MKLFAFIFSMLLLFSHPIIGVAQNLQVSTLIPDIDASGGMTIDHEGNIYVSDFGPALGQPQTNTKVYKIDKTDFSVSVFAEGFAGASGACFDADGNFYQANPHGNKVSKKGVEDTLNVDWAIDGFSTPIGIVADSENNVFVCNCSSNTISKITPAGMVTEFASDTLFRCPNGLTIDDQNNLYACNYGNGGVTKITPDGTVSLLAELPVLTAGPNTIGCGHLTYNKGFLFVTTVGTGQVFKVSLTGETEAIAGVPFGFDNTDGPASTATFSKPNGIIASQTGDTLFINDAEPIWPDGTLGLHPAHVRMVTGLCTLPDIVCSAPPGPLFTQVNSGPVATNLSLNMGSSWADYNEDGFVDLLIMGGIGDNQLYQNNGNGNFTLNNGIVSNDGGNSSAAVWGDYDNDGDLDLYVSNNPPAAEPPEANFLYQNSGAPDFTFTKITDEGPVTDVNYTWSSTWVDYDNDGDLDLHVPENRHLGLDYFYENSGTPDANGRYFTAITPAFVTPNVESSGVASWMDYDNDGDQDLFLIKSGRTLPAGGEDNRMYHNTLSETGILDFQRIVTAEMVTHFDLDFQASWGDYDNDGDMDVYLGNFDAANYLYQNQGDSLFTRITEGDAVTESAPTLGSTWGDFDNDGDLDLYATSPGQVSRYYQNDGTGNLSSQGVAVVGPPAVNISSCQSASSADFNNDGYLDIFVGNAAFNGQVLPDFLYRNNGGDDGYLILTCRGTTSNRAGIGTKIRLKANINGQDVWQMRVVSGGPTGDRAQNSLRAHFGLGDATIIDSLVIQWTSGQQDVYTQIHTHQICTVTEGQGSDCLSLVSSTTLPDFITSFVVAPNPLQDDTLAIQYQVAAVNHLTFLLFDVNGQLVRQEKTSNTGYLEMNVSALPAGNYFIQLKTEKGRVTRVVVKY
ncbi:MAG: hypothetical protein DHS20C18_32170 [Saprospiraceae bacterium]|nr:MAG: hypothetical protein DHS20C18_32170 [Saprospiraceae bacterium]